MSMPQVLAGTTAEGVPEAQLQAAVAHTVVAHDADGDGCLGPHEFRELVTAALQPVVTAC